MATAKLGAATPPKQRLLRYFFPGMAAFAFAFLVTVFVPEFQRFAAGTFPIAWLLHVHAAIMFSWAGSFALQAWLGATGRTDIHRRTGRYAIAIGWLAFVSMVFVEFRGLAVYPLPLDPADYDWTLPGPFIYLTFGIFLAWAFHERKRPQWHKRLMTFALFLSVGAAIQRFAWIPRPHGYEYAPIALVIDVVLLVPLIAYDLRTQRGQLHPATLRGALLLFIAEAILLALWGTATWRDFAAEVALRVHG